MTEDDKPEVRVTAVAVSRSLSAEIRSAVAWLAFTIAGVAYPFGYLDLRACWALTVGAAVLALSTVRPNTRR